MNNLQSQDPKVLLKEAKVPVRCINSAGGFAFSNRPTARSTRVRQLDFVTIDAVGHYPMLEKSAEFNQKRAAC